MTSLQEHEMMWTRADAILEQSSNPNTKFFALQVLEGVIKYRWNALPDDHQAQHGRGFVPPRPRVY